MPERPLSWFRERSVVTAAGCWELQKQPNNNGYPYVYILGSASTQQRSEPAHAAVARITYGPRPAGMQVMHSCDNRRCCNPAHLSYGTQAENMRHMWDQGRGWTPFTALGAAKAALTRCVHGHEFTEENTYRPKRGGRMCRRCHADMQNARYHRIRSTQAQKAKGR